MKLAAQQFPNRTAHLRLVEPSPRPASVELGLAIERGPHGQPVTIVTATRGSHLLHELTARLDGCARLWRVTPETVSFAIVSMPTNPLPRPDAAPSAPRGRILPFRASSAGRAGTLARHDNRH